MRGIDFYTDHLTGEAMYRFKGELVARQLTEQDIEIINFLLEKSKTFYPEQYNALCEEYKLSAMNKSYYDFLRARRIINCCFGENDREWDIDDEGNYHFELVKCPRLAECKYYKVICQPTFNSTLSDREMEVMKMYFDHIPTEKIAESLYLSIHTVNNHRRNALQKLGLRSMDEFRDYVYKNKIFDR